MKPIIKAAVALSACFLMAGMAAPHLYAQPSQNNKADKGKGGDRGGVQRFTDVQRREIQSYYSQQIRSGNCPPGLAKKNNGCLPPGQARKWAIGQPLPADVIIYELPPQVSIQIGVPPSGHRFVRVASDILLIAIGTAIVVDAIEDFGR